MTDNRVSSLVHLSAVSAVCRLQVYVEVLHSLQTSWMRGILARRRWHRWYHAITAMHRWDNSILIYYILYSIICIEYILI